MILGSDDKRPEINYPCNWDYKVIGSDVEKVLTAINDTVDGLKYDVSPSNLSNSGKYCSINLKVHVVTEDERNFIYSSLASHNDIIMVL